MCGLAGDTNHTKLVVIFPFLVCSLITSFLVYSVLRRDHTDSDFKSISLTRTSCILVVRDNFVIGGFLVTYCCMILTCACTVYGTGINRVSFPP